MIRWVDEGLLLSVRPHGESAAIVEALTRGHGRHSGLVHGGQGRRRRPGLQPGNRVALHWQARLEDHLGVFRVEAVEAAWSSVMQDEEALAALASALALLAAFTPEREALPNLYDATRTMLATLTDADTWPTAYVHWELGLLGVLGYGLSLDRCAVTGRREGLAWVSPRTGRAVSWQRGLPHADRLLPLPAFLWRGGAAADREAWRQAMRITGHFLGRRVAAAVHRGLPEARARLLAKFRSAPEPSGAANSREADGRLRRDVFR